MVDIENQIVRNDDIQLVVIPNGRMYRDQFLYLGAIIMILFIVLAIFYFVFIIFSIMSLCRTSYYDQKELCRESDVWIFIIICLIITPSLSINIIKSYGKDKKTLAINCLIYIIRCISELYGTLLYNILKINLIYGVLFIFISGLTTCFS